MAADRFRGLQVDLEHLPEEYAVLILYFGLAFALLHFSFLVDSDVSRLGWLFHVDARFDIAQALHVHQVVFDALSVVDVAVGRMLDPHCCKNGDLNYNQF